MQMNPLRFEFVTAGERLSAVAEPWAALWAGTEASAFQSHPWISAWWSSLGAGAAELLVAVAWDREAAMAILPLAIERRRGARVLVWAAEAVSDYCDALAADNPAGHQALAQLWGKVREGCGADLINLKQVRPDAKIRPLLTLPAGGHCGLGLREDGGLSFQVVNHWANGASYFRSLNKKGRNNHTRGKRILGESGHLTFRRVEPHEAAPVLDRLFELKARWVAATGSQWPLLANPAAGLRPYGDALASIGRLALFVLEVDGAVVAATLNILDGPRMLAFVAAYDLAFERASPGTILMVDYAMWAFDAGLREIDYLRGEQPYKLRFANARTALSGYHGSQTTKGRVLYALYLAKKRWDRWRGGSEREEQGSALHPLEPAAPDPLN